MSTTESLTCPYQGPIPLDRDQPLFGRGSAVATLCRMVIQRQLVTVTASSGVGKTSLLQAGLIPSLEEAGFTVARFSEWGGLEGEDPDERFVAAIRWALNEDPDAEDETLIDTMERWRGLHGSQLVVIFDQFEELFRQDRELGIGFLGTLQDVLSGAAPYPFKYVLSLRSEFKDEVAALERALDPRDYDSYKLEELSVDVAEELIGEAPTIVLPAPGVVIDPHAVRFLADGWNAARGRDRASNAVDSPVGMLHLQALLWRLWHDIKPVLGSTITHDDLLRVGLPPDFATSTDAARDEFSEALEDYAERRLKTFTDGWPNADQARETRYLLGDLVPLLSSGTYKLIRETPDLAAESLPEALLDLGVPDRVLADAVAWAERRAGLDAVAEDALKAELESHLVSHGFDTTPDIALNPAAGRLFGASPARVVAELVVGFRRAIDWLEDAHLVRTAQTRQRTRVVALVHDGFGPALTRWAARVRSEPERAFTGLLALSGIRVFPSLQPDGSRRTVKVDTSGEHRHVIWQGCIVEGALEDLTFVECDFRGTLFLRSDLRRVTFRDCILWGALFKGCTMDDVTIESTHGGGFGAGAVTRSDRERRLDEIQTLTFGPGGTIDQGGVTLRGLSGYGVFFIDVTGGPLGIEDCDLTHVGVRPGAGASLIRLTASRLRHFDYQGGPETSLEIEHSLLLFHSVPGAPGTYDARGLHVDYPAVPSKRGSVALRDCDLRQDEHGAWPMIAAEW